MKNCYLIWFRNIDTAKSRIIGNLTELLQLAKGQEKNFKKIVDELKHGLKYRYQYILESFLRGFP